MKITGKVKIGKATIDIAFNKGDIDIIKAKTPVVTGKLKRGFKLDSSGNIVNDVDYATYVEFGHHTRSGSWVPAQGMIMKSTGEIGKRVLERVRKQLKGQKVLVPTKIDIKIQL